MRNAKNIMVTVQTLLEKECIEVAVLSELKFQAKELAVPLDELALVAIDTCAQDASAKRGAETSWRNNIDDYAQKFFSDDCKVVPSDDEVLEMSRWAQWSSTPNFAGNCVRVSQAITFITKHYEEIEAACKKLEIVKILRSTKKYSAMLSEPTKESLVQIFDAIFKHQPTTAEGI